ncbi:MAG: pSer/pThr/pTyr-binding forkhead associated (FHA) protein/tetratricopeptide (TPR) repeat protein [Kiritimatiellia bacterium]
MGEMEVIIRQPGRPERVVPLDRGAHTLGRSDDNQLVLPDIGVSRQHARVHVTPEGVRIEDVGSGNGTWRDGRRVRPSDLLGDGDMVLIDPFTLEFRKAASSAPRYTPGSIRARVSAEARLDVVHGPSLAQRSYLIPGAGLSLGRSEYRDLVVLDPAASRHHCDVVRRDDGYYLIDNDSSNGVFLNDERVNDAMIYPGDVIRIGNTELRFVMLDGTEEISPLGGSTDQLQPWDLKTVNEAWTQDLSLPIPEAEAMALLGETPKSHPPRTSEPTPGLFTTAPVFKGRGPWLPLSLGALAAATLALAMAAAAAMFVIVAMRSGTSHEVIQTRAQLGPRWQLELPAGLPPTQVPVLFDEGVSSMLQQEPRAALERFYRVLLAEPGNPAAERWSVAAGEHLMLQAMHEELIAQAEVRSAHAANRDTLLDQWSGSPPRRRSIEKRLREDQFRDDPLVLSRLGWVPSRAEKELGKRVDAAFGLANSGQLAEAEAAFRGVLAITNNPVVKSRATLGLATCREHLAAEVAVQWREGVLAELRGDVAAARAHFRRVLETDPNNPSARAHLSYLGTAGG